MSPVFLVNYVTGRQQIRSKSIDGCLKHFPQKKIYVKKQFDFFFMFVGTTVLSEYMNLLRNYVYNLFVNTHVRIKIYQVLSWYYLK